MLFVQNRLPRTLIGSAALAVAACTSVSHADIITTLVTTSTYPTGAVPVTTGPYAGQYAYTYDTQLGFNSELMPTTPTASMFGTVYDVSNSINDGSLPLFVVTAGTALATDFKFTEDLTDTPASKVNPTDLSTMYNLRFTYNNSAGAPTLMGSTMTETLSIGGSNITIPVGTGLMDLGTFVIYSPSSTTTSVNYDGQTLGSTGYTSAGTVQANIGTTLVPTAVPEPSTLSLLGLGAAGLLGRRRRAQ